jgi:hypothetical protein
MPEKGWKIVTVRDGTKEILKEQAKARKVSINDLIVDALARLSS